MVIAPAVLMASPVAAHWGHLADLGGHAHWAGLALGAVAAALAAGLAVADRARGEDEDALLASEDPKEIQAMHDVKAPKYGVMICGHGSRSKSAVTEFAVLAEKLAPLFPDWPVEYGYLEFATPVIKTGLDKLREQGVTHVLAVPGMLFAAGHAKNDIPSVLNTYAAEHGISIQYGRELAIDLQMLQAAGDRVAAALDEADAANGPSTGQTPALSSSVAGHRILMQIPIFPRFPECCGKAWASAGPRSAIPA